MALGARTRSWLIRGAWAGLLVAASVYVGVKVGRPIYYTDGERQVAAHQLAASGMVAWQTPEITCELPGPVQGRVAELPDGRLLYGRSQPDGTTDLVVFDPRKPGVPPEPAYGLNSPGNELAPAIGSDGRVYFASDRTGGVGGYDLYTAPLQRAGFGPVEPLTLCNTARDEVDPAPHPNGRDLVFVRIERQAVERSGDEQIGSLWRCERGGQLDPVPVFGALRGPASVHDRDPAFAADGGALWFVRKARGEPLRVQRATWQAGELAAPLPVGQGWGTAEMRGPQPSADGFSLGLLQPQRQGEGDLWYRATAREVYPWWPGQRWLEWWLLGIVAFCAVLLVLLHLGRHWSALDLVVQCMLLSLLLHVLLFLWLMGVEIRGALLRGPDDGSGFVVQVVLDRAAASGAPSDGPTGSDLAANVQFAERPRELGAAAPGVEVERATKTNELQGPAGEWQHEVEAGDTAVAAALEDAVAVPAARDGQEVTTAPAATELPAVTARPQAWATAAAVPAQAGREAVVIAAPASGLEAARAPAQPLASAVGSGAAPSQPTARSQPAPASAVQDATSELLAAGQPLRAAAAPEAGQADGIAQAQLVDLAAQRSAPATAERLPTAAQPVGSDAAPVVADLLSRTANPLPAPAAASSAAATTAPIARASAPRAVALRDDAVPVAAPVARAAANTPVSTSERLAPVAVEALNSPSATARATSVPAVARQLGAVAAVPEVRLTAPDAELVRGGARIAPAAAARTATNSGVPVARGAAPQAVVLRDTPVSLAGAPSQVPTDTTANVPSAARPQPLAALVPRSFAPIARRSADLGFVARRPIVVPPPISVLERPVAQLADLPQPLPQQTQATAYSNRFGPAKAKALEEFGGTAATERAVADGLRYLAGIQNADGSWGDRSDYDSKYGLVYVGKTALCVLAFLGAGHTPSSNSEHSAIVAKAIAHLVALQDPDTGAFGPSSCYGHGITTYAIAECYGLTRDPQLRHVLENALTWILDNQGPRKDRRNRGGWGYFSPGLQAEDNYARVSVTSWMVMALESARLSGVDLPKEVLPRAREFLEAAYDQPNGWFRYNHKPSRLDSAWPTLPASTPAGGFCLMLLGKPKDDPMVEAAAAFTAARRPDAYRRFEDDEFVLRGQGNVYFWYYGSLCCFLKGGETWRAWNERLSTVLPQAQNRDGSFTPIDVYAREAGDNNRDRSYTTAMCVLCLEVYYRYFTPLLIGR